MKKILFIVILLSYNLSIQAQSINFEAVDLEKRPNLIYANLGIDFGVTTTSGYARGFKVLDRKLFLLADYAFPMGKISGDFKLKIGAQYELYNIKRFKIASKLHISYNNYSTINSSFSAANSLGLETGVLIGYYHSRWYIAGEFGLDKLVFVHLEQNEQSLNIYLDKDILMSSNFRFGLQGGYSFTTVDLILRLGVINNFQFNSSLFPLYGQLEAHYRF